MADDQVERDAWVQSTGWCPSEGRVTVRSSEAAFLVSMLGPTLSGETMKPDMTELVVLDPDRLGRGGYSRRMAHRRSLLLKAAADGMEKCGTCDGSGKIMQGNRECPDCKGKGEVAAKC